MLQCGNLFGADNIQLQAELRNALHVESLLQRDVDYIVREKRIELVDELTGRVAKDRHWADGIQAALEAKEGLFLGHEGQVLGSITVQHFLHKYPQLCGMTATAKTAVPELAEVYGLTVQRIATNRACARIDAPDLIFRSQESKRPALVDAISCAHRRVQPTLVGTLSVRESEELAGELERAEVPCRVLNAKRDEEEASIIAEAGAPGAVTISTNMAGRGTDIRLGGSNESERDQVLAVGGLAVFGTNRHESRRIDDQLRGRAGRQGDPGSSRFFVSLEDPLLRRYGIERLLPSRSAEALDHPIVAREVARAQRIIEGQHADARTRLVRYEQVLERQRSELQGRRQAVLEGREDSGLVAKLSPERWRERRLASAREKS